MKKTVILSLILFNLFSCSKRDLQILNPSTYFPDSEAGDEITILKNSSPENVFENMKTAYNHKNPNLYLTTISKDYRFYMSDSYLGAIQKGNISVLEPGVWTTENSINNVGNPVIQYYKDYAQEASFIRKFFDPLDGAKHITLTFDYSKINNRPDTISYRIGNIELTFTHKSSLIPIVAKNGSLPSEATLVLGSDSLWKILVWQDNTGGEGDAF